MYFITAKELQQTHLEASDTLLISRKHTAQISYLLVLFQISMHLSNNRNCFLMNCILRNITSQVKIFTLIFIETIYLVPTYTAIK